MIDPRKDDLRQLHKINRIHVISRSESVRNEQNNFSEPFGVQTLVKRVDLNDWEKTERPGLVKNGYVTVVKDADGVRQRERVVKERT